MTLAEPTQAAPGAGRTVAPRLELLLFQLDGTQVYGINVFKVREVVRHQPLTRISGAHPVVKGIVTVRDTTIPVIDLSAATGGPGLNEPEKGYIVVTEFNRSVHGFLIRRLERIVSTQWEQVQHLPEQLGRNAFVTAITMLENDRIVEILDVEKILDQVMPTATDVSRDLSRLVGSVGSQRVLAVDDSSVARNQIARAMEQLGVDCLLFRDGVEAREALQQFLEDGVDVADEFALIICDIEMPRMDGYHLTEWIRSEPRLHDLYVLLHSSIDGAFNADLVRSTGANRFLQKYHPDELARAVLERIDQRSHP